MLRRLWAPWRFKLFALPKTRACIFCAIPRSSGDRRSYLLFRGAKTFVMMNLYPYNNGHLLIAPYRHIPNLRKADPGELFELFQEARRATVILDRVLKPDGYNMGINMGRAGGAVFAGHLHLHLVPRWTGDTNFMATVDESRVITRSLDALYRLLLKNYAR